MTILAQAFRRVITRSEPEGRAAEELSAPEVTAELQGVDTPPVEIAPNDPIVAYFQSSSGTVDIETLELDSPGVDALRDAGVKLVVPLVSQGELIGLLNLGPRLSEQDYSGDDRKLLENLATLMQEMMKAKPSGTKGLFIRSMTLTTTMGPGIRLDINPTVALSAPS